MNPRKKRKIINALEKSFNIAVVQSLKIMRSTEDHQVFEMCLRRFYINKGLPKDYENTLEMRYLSAYYRDTQKLQIIDPVLTSAQEDEACDLLLEAGEWLHKKWAPKLKELLLKVCDGYEGVRDLVNNLYDARERTPNGIHYARMISYIVEI